MSQRARSMVVSISIAAVAAQAFGFAALGFAAPALGATPIDVPFAYTGAEQSWDVPAGVASIHVVLVGGRGGQGQTSAIGGSPHKVTGDLAVTPGTTIYVEVGGGGLSGGASGAGGFNGGGAGGNGGGTRGGGGGGASDLRTVARASVGTLASRLIVAAGGGGGGGGNSGGIGGTAGGPGQGGTAAQPGQPGTQAAGGSGGTGISSSGGAPGISGTGGGGDPASSDAGGGGGAGYFGGGGGGGTSTFITPGGAGGGGGSSFVGAATNSAVSVDASGSSVTITYTPGVTPSPSPSGPPDNGAVAAQVTVPSSAACIELSTSSIDFGTLPLGAANQPATPDITVTNCGELTSSIYAHGSDASGAGGAAWSLVNSTETCADTLGLDHYRLGLARNFAQVGLSTADAFLTDLDPGLSADHTARIYTACPGSTGSGTVMSMTLTFLATTSGG